MKDEAGDVIGYFENLSLHLAKESLPYCLDVFLSGSDDALNYFASPRPALEIFSLLKDGTAKPMMRYLSLLKEQGDYNFKSIVSNIPVEGILAVFSLAKEDSETFFGLITDEQNEVYEERYAEFNFSTNWLVQKFGEFWADKTPEDSMVKTMDFFDDLNIDDAKKLKL
jgi:hypothetical protein